MTYIIIALVILVAVVVVINKIRHRNFEKVSGKIVSFIEEAGVHYPVFSFTTLDGRNIEKRSIAVVDGENFECNVEGAYAEPEARSFLVRTLPINNIPISYNKNNPEEFTAKWI